MTELNTERSEDADGAEPAPMAEQISEAAEPESETETLIDAPLREGLQDVQPPIPPMPLTSPTSAVKKTKKPSRLSRIPRGVRAALVGAIILGGLLGAAITAALQPDPTTTKPYLALKDTASSQSAAMASESASISSLQSEKSGLQSQVNAAASQSAAVASAQASVQARESAVAQREQAVQSAQAVIVQNQIGHGVFVVGKDVKAGTYHTTGPDGSNFSGCYYEWKGSTDANAQIIDNNISQGPATATLTDGQVFTTNGCQAWQKIG